MIVTELLMNRQKGNLLVTIMMLLLRWWYQFPCEISLIEHGGTGERPIRAENVKLKLWLETILSAQQRSALRSSSGKKKKVKRQFMIDCSHAPPFYFVFLLNSTSLHSHNNFIITWQFSRYKKMVEFPASMKTKPGNRYDWLSFYWLVRKKTMKWPNFF